MERNLGDRKKRDLGLGAMNKAAGIDQLKIRVNEVIEDIKKGIQNAEVIGKLFQDINSAKLTNNSKELSHLESKLKVHLSNSIY